MPKEIFELKDFSGGLVNGPDPRDVEDNMLHKLVNCVTTKFGKIQLMGAERPHAISADTEGGTTAVTASLTPGFGLHTVRSDFPQVSGSYEGQSFGPQDYDENMQLLSEEWELSPGQVSASNTDASNGKVKVSPKYHSTKHHLSTGSLVLVRERSGTNTGHDATSWTPIERLNATEFQYTNPAGISGVSGLPVANWVSGDSSLNYADLDPVLGFPEVHSGSYTFLCIQNSNFFHIYQNETESFFYDIAKIIEVADSQIKPAFEYIDTSLRVCDSNFNNATPVAEITQNNAYETTRHPRMLTYVDRQSNFITGAHPDGKSVIPGWRDELNAPYEANGILTYHEADVTVNNAGGTNNLITTTGADGAIFKVQRESDGNAITFNADEINDVSGFMQVNMGMAFNTANGDWMMESDSIHSLIKFGVAYIFNDEQESRIFKNNVEIAMASGQEYSSLNYQFVVNQTVFPVTCKGFSIYIWYLNGELEDPLWLGRALFDSNKGWEGHDGTRLPWQAATNATVHSNNDSLSVINAQGSNDLRMRQFPVLTYRLRNGYKHDLDSATFRYKTSTLINRKLYIGNVMQVSGSLHNRIYSDRIIKSPVNKFDILPENSFIDVSTNDGESIIKLIGFQNKLLQFKEQTLYVIDVSETYEYLEAEEKFKGVSHPDAVTKFSGGVAWANKLGAYIYNGQETVNIVDQRIDELFWRSCVGTGKVSTGFIPQTNELIFYFNHNPYDSEKIDSLGQSLGEGVATQRSAHDHLMLFDLDAQTWAFGQDKLGSDVKTNLVDDFDDKLIFGVGTGLVNENHNVTETQTGRAAYHGYGHFQFLAKEGSLESATYDRLCFYFNDTGSGSAGWVELGRISYDNWGYDFSTDPDTALQYSGQVYQALAPVIDAYNVQFLANNVGYYAIGSYIDPGLDETTDEVVEDPT
tara:strand:+ start:7592 stop:10363 length:2772 start_codon:yes stop_codon:yes gene_type:complete